MNGSPPHVLETNTSRTKQVFLSLLFCSTVLLVAGYCFVRREVDKQWSLCRLAKEYDNLFEFESADKSVWSIRRAFGLSPPKYQEFFGFVNEGTADSVQDTVFKRLCDLRNIKRVHLEDSTVSDAGLECLPKLQSLHDFSSNSLTRNCGAEYISEASELEVLDLRRSTVSEEGMRYISRLKKVEILDVSRSHTTDAALEHVGKMVSLQSLWIRSSLVTDKGIAHLSSLKNLYDLHLDRTQLSDAGMPHLTTLQNLRLLDLKRTQVSDEGLIHLERLPGIQSLEVKGAKVTVEGARLLKSRMPSIRYVDILDDEK